MRNLKHLKTQWLCLLAFTLCCPVLVFAQSTATPARPHGDSISWLDHLLLEDSIGILEVRLETDLKNLMRNKADEKYQPAVFKYKNKAGEEKVYNAEVKPRGKTRKEICVHPPLKLKIKKADLTNAGMLPFNEMKIVWECKPSGAFEQYLYKEYLAYRLYNRVTSASFRAKLLKINLVDTNSPTKVIEKIGFIVEDEDQVADRLTSLEMAERPKDSKQFARQHFLNFVLFEYMIGNTDWAFGNMHNSRFFEHITSKKVIPVPYDFDYSGLVNAPYAIPHESLPIQNVRERYFKGGVVNAPEGMILRKQFLDSKPAVLDCINNFPHFDKFTKQDVIDFILEFYRELEDEKRFLRILNP